MKKSFIGDPFSVSLISGTKKVLIKGGGGIKIVRRKFLSHSVENFRRGESFSVSLFSVIENVRIRMGSIKIFHRKLFVSQCRKIS